MKNEKNGERTVYLEGETKRRRKGMKGGGKEGDPEVVTAKTRGRRGEVERRKDEENKAAQAEFFNPAPRRNAVALGTRGAHQVWTPTLRRWASKPVQDMQEKGKYGEINWVVWKGFRV